MKNNKTELVFILDRSGSMSGLESDTIGGFNSMLKKQKGEPGEAFVTTVLFDTRFERKHDRVKLEDVAELTAADYIPGGCTALLDAIGDTIRHIVHIHRYARPEDVPEKTVFVIMTDGYENASHRFTRDEVKRMIEHEQEKYGWEFLFLGANIDAIQTAGGIGIRADRTTNFNPDDVGVELSFDAVTQAVGAIRERASVSRWWSKAVEADHAQRRSKR